MATFIENAQDIFPESKMFTPDFSFIDTMLKRKESQYEQGFAQLNNQYSLINREVTHSSNAAIRDQFLNNAKTSLKNLSSVDLSDSQNVNAAVNVFKPFYSNTNVIGDQAITAHWNQQVAIGNSLRLKDGGKEFSEDNINYIMQQKKAFAADDPSSVNEYAASKRYYTPYYDWNKEVKEAMKDFKPTHTKIEKLNGMYTKTVDDQSWNKLEIAQYLNSVLSDKAKQQMRIEGAVRLGDNPKFLVQNYLETEAADLPHITGLIDKIDVDLKSEKDPAKIAELKRNRDYYDDQRAEITNNLKSLRGGDMSFLKKNSEPIAFKSYYNAQVGKLAGGYSHKDIEQTIGYDQVAMMYYKNAEDWKRTIYSADRAEQLKDKELKSKFTDPLTIEQPGENISGDFETLNKTVEEKGAIRQQLWENVKGEIALVLKKPITSITEADYRNYISTHKSSDAIQKYMTASSSYDAAQQAITLQKEAAENYVKTNMSPTDYNILKEAQSVVKTTNTQVQLTKNAIAEGRADRGALFNLQSPLTGYAAIAKKYGVSVDKVKDLVATSVAYKKDFNSQTYTASTKNTTGFTLAVSDPRYERTENYLKAIGIKEPSGIGFFPDADPTKFNIRYKVSDEIAKDNAASEITRLQQSLGIQNVTYNPATKSITIGGLGEKIAKSLDPYYTLPSLHREVLNNLHNFNGPVNSNLQSPFIPIQDKLGNNYVFNITKLIQNGGSKYVIDINGKRLGYTFANDLDALSAVDDIVNDPNKINFVLNQK
jgi:hypothetical protein